MEEDTWLVTGKLVNLFVKYWQGNIQKGVAGAPDPLKNHKNVGFLSNTCLDPLKNHKATKPALSAVCDCGIS